jgi:hypothetical protein
MRTKRRNEGYLLVDHSNSPGLTDAEVGVMTRDAPSGAGKVKYEAAILGCAHCGMQSIRNPFRTRDRPYCAKCDAYVCDACKLAMVLTGRHRPMAMICDEIQQGRALPLLGAIHG